MVEALLPFSSDAREYRFADAADEEVMKRVRRMNENELRGLVFELAMEHALLQAWTGYSKELKTACKLFGVNLKSAEAQARKALRAAEQERAPDPAPATTNGAEDREEEADSMVAAQ